MRPRRVAAVPGRAPPQLSCESGVVPRLDPRPRLSTVLAVLLLAVAVVAMHSMAAGHGGSPVHDVTTAGTRHHADHVSRPMTYAQTVPAAGTVLGISGTAPTACAMECAGPASTGAGHDASAMCLAVLSTLLALVLLRVARAGVCRVPATACAPPVPVLAPTRGPPRRMAVAMGQVCVLRT